MTEPSLPLGHEHEVRAAEEQVFQAGRDHGVLSPPYTQALLAYYALVRQNRNAPGAPWYDTDDRYADVPEYLREAELQ